MWKDKVPTPERMQDATTIDPRGGSLVQRKNSGTDSIPFKTTLARIMRERNLTLKIVAGLAGVPKSVVQGWLTGSNPHDLLAVARLAKALGVGFKALLLDEPEDIPCPNDLTHDKVTILEGLCEVTIKKLIPKGR